eukprot:1177945-Pyramimonas_sp.AAC.1
MAKVRRESQFCYVDCHPPPLRACPPGPPLYWSRWRVRVFRPALQYQYVRLDPPVTRLSPRTSAPGPSVVPLVNPLGVGLAWTFVSTDAAPARRLHPSAPPLSPAHLLHPLAPPLSLARLRYPPAPPLSPASRLH